jgi:hypothetical protein
MWAMRTHTMIRPLAAALVAACALAAAACGGDDGAGGTASAAERDREARDAALKYARCMREHGVDMPDPSASGGPQRFKVGPGTGISRREYEEAEKACRKYMEDVKPAELSTQEQQEFKEAALAHARCMREHGVENFPDPTFGENGEAQIRLRKGMGLDPDDPAFKKAEQACADTMPAGPSTSRAEAP